MVKKQEIFCHLFVYLLLHYINGGLYHWLKIQNVSPPSHFPEPPSWTGLVFCRLILFDTHVLCKNI